jgi:hypothetical protein
MSKFFQSDKSKVLMLKSNKTKHLRQLKSEKISTSSKLLVIRLGGTRVIFGQL